MEKKKVIAVAIGLLLLAAVLLPGLVDSPIAGASPAEDRGIISVYGEAVITAQPDSARVVLAVETTHDLAKTAAEENAPDRRSAQALAASGIDEKQLKTSGYRLNSYNQQVDPQNREKYITKYRAYNELTVNLHNLDEVGNVIDTAVKAGANRVLSVFFELKEAEALKLQALQNAATQAKAKAEAIARSTGVAIKGIKVIHEEMSGYTPYRAAVEESAKMMDAGPTPILPGDVEVTARVNAEYYF